MFALSFSSRRFTTILSVGLLAALLCGAGCGGEDKNKSVVLAKVGDKEISAAYYEDRLLQLGLADLPRDDKGVTLDTASRESKLKFLDTIVNKDVMVAVATRMGFDADPQIEAARKTLTSYEAVKVARDRFIDKPASEVSEKDIKDFYDNLGRSRRCRYLITNFHENAVKVRELSLAGTDWADLFRDYHDGSKLPGGGYEMSIQYGKFISSFEDPIFACEIGGITQPVPSTYGWWVLRIDSEETLEKPTLEEARPTIVATIVNRNKMKLVDAFRDNLRIKHKMVVHEDALLKAYQGLPVDEDMFYPGTKDPVRREDLTPLVLDAADFDMPFYAYERGGVPRHYTLGDFKTAYDRMSVFERPKWGDMLGGLRSKITGEIDTALLNFESEDRGLFTDPEVLARVEVRIEEMLVGKLYEEAVHWNKDISAAALDTFWAAHAAEYNVPEMRVGKRIVCADAAQAAAAHAALTKGDSWRSVINNFGVDEAEKAGGGKMQPVRADAEGPFRDALFGLQINMFSAPFAVDNGQHAVVILDEITPPGSQDLASAAEVVARRIRDMRQEAAFRDKLAEWKKDIPIVIHEKRLEKMRSWKELTDELAQSKTAAAK